MGIVNVVGSSISLLTHCGVHVNAGPEIDVAFTKAYTLQFIVYLPCLSARTGAANTSAARNHGGFGQHLGPDQDGSDQDQAIKKMCKQKFKNQKSLLVLGRGSQFSTALDGAFKIKEISYLHCEVVMSGELKHGVMALVDEPAHHRDPHPRPSLHEVTERLPAGYVFVLLLF